MIDHPGCAEKIIEPTPVAIEGSPRRDVAQEVEQNRPIMRPLSETHGLAFVIEFSVESDRARKPDQCHHHENGGV